MSFLNMTNLKYFAFRSIHTLTLFLSLSSAPAITETKNWAKELERGLISTDLERVKEAFQNGAKVDDPIIQNLGGALTFFLVNWGNRDQKSVSKVFREVLAQPQITANMRKKALNNAIIFQTDEAIPILLADPKLTQADVLGEVGLLARGPFSSCAADCSLKVFKLFLKSPFCDINTRDALGNTALNYASESGNLPIIRYLLNQPDLAPEINKNNDGMQAIHHAVISDHVEALKLLIESERFSGQELGPQNETLLFLALQTGRLKTLRFLIDRFDYDKIFLKNSRNESAFQLPLQVFEFRGIQIVIRKAPSLDIQGEIALLVKSLLDKILENEKESGSSMTIRDQVAIESFLEFLNNLETDSHNFSNSLEWN